MYINKGNNIIIYITKKKISKLYAYIYTYPKNIYINNGNDDGK